MALAQLGVNVQTATTDDDGPGRRTERTADAPVDVGAARRVFRKQSDFYKISLPFLRWITREVHQFDVVHIHALFSFTSVAAAWAARRSGVPYVIRPLGVLNAYGVAQRRPLLKRLSLRLIEGPLLRDAAAVHFTSDSERDEALTLGVPLRAMVIPLAVTVAPVGIAQQFLQGKPMVAAAPRLLYLSRLDPKKNLEGLIRAVALLQAEGLRPALLVAGSGDPAYLLSLKLLVQAQGVADQVHWLGQVSGQDKADLLAASNLFVLPSFSENFGIAVAEALASGLPCVVARGVALAADVAAAGAGISCDPDPASLADALSTLLKDEVMRYAMAARAVNLAQERYSVMGMGKRLLALYSDLTLGKDIPICSAVARHMPAAS